METTHSKRRHIPGKVLLGFVIFAIGGIAYFFYCLNRGLETKPLKLIEFYELAKAHQWDEMTRRTCCSGANEETSRMYASSTGLLGP